MRTDRTVLLHLAVAATLLYAFDGYAGTLIVCRTPDGATYATDNPPPDCAPIPPSEIQRFPAYSGEETEERALEMPPPANIVPPPPPPPVFTGDDGVAPPLSAESRRAAAEEPSDTRTHAIASCEQSVAEQLERPSSARWPNRSDYKFRDRGSGRVEIDGHVEAEKALGSSRIEWSCNAAFAGDRWVATAQLREQAPPPPVAASVPPPQFPPPVPAAQDATNTGTPEWMREPAREPMPEPVVRERARETAAVPAASLEQRPRIAEPPPPTSFPPSATYDQVPPPSMSAYQAPPTSSSELWKERSSCPGIKFDVAAQTHRNEGYQIVSGQIMYTGRSPVRDVRVCASGTCVLVRGASPPMTNGASEKFSVKVPSLDTAVVTAQCSVQIDGPGT